MKPVPTSVIAALVVPTMAGPTLVALAESLVWPAVAVVLAAAALRLVWAQTRL